MADWDADGPKLQQNLEQALESIAVWAEKRGRINATTIKRWHRQAMAGLDVPHPKYVARFRGEAGLEGQPVYIGPRQGTVAHLVVAEVSEFTRRLQNGFNGLDAIFSVGSELDRDGLQAVIELAAWTHCEWVRIHPFCNGNGRTARMLANAVLMRYALPPILRLRPRPLAPYGSAGAACMDRDTQPMETLILALLRSYPD